jgi:hypothetical protein
VPDGCRLQRIPGVVLALDTLTYLVSDVLIGRIGDLNAPAGEASPGTRLMKDIRDGLSYLWREAVIRTLSLTGFAFRWPAGGWDCWLSMPTGCFTCLRPTDASA